MYIRLTYYSGDRSLVESIRNDGAEGIVSDKVLFLDAVDNDGDALRFQHNNGSHFDVIFLSREGAQHVYEEILDGIRDRKMILEMDIREHQIGEDIAR